MNKSIKRVVSIVLAISAFSVLEPVKYSNITNIKAYADDDIYLRGISVTDGDDIALNSSKKTYTTNVPNADTSVVIRVTTNDKNDKVTIDGDSNTTKVSDRKFEETVDLNKGINTFDIVVQNEDGEKERDYTLKIDRGGKQSTDSDSVFLNSIKVDYGDIDFSKTTYSYDLNVDEAVDQLRVEADPENNNYIVRIDGEQVDDSEKFRREVNLSKGENSISIDVEDDQDDTNSKTYTLNVYRGKNPTNTNNTADTNVKFDNDQDPIYLDDIVLDDGDVKFTPNFNKKVTSYNVDVPEDKEDIIVKGEPAIGSDIVKINGTTADSKNRQRVSLTKGKNVIEVRVNTDCDQDDKNYEKRTYTLTVYRGTSEGTSTTANANNTQNTSTTATNSNTGKPNQWLNLNGKWQYNDSTGNPLKNTWYYDKNYGKTYYFDKDGNMVTGWLLNSGVWYYLDQSGAKITGWKQLGANWYYLDSDGKMKTGWFKDITGKWYYLDQSGAMVSSGTVDGYKLASDGALV
ncbi:MULTISPECIES: cadherin-like beta sandwich domain-containing protein [unclassified Clostridium]|uniref:cadherin-like beta sandwich domain-containing protein n=1 Tax=unclassified Clostridium TaxID=2614128 RepID=UPI00029756B9|nr:MULTISPECIES: cadherin-like beta sandwich domain-containing protein [unclassified Clostridium]EKQ50545.1 MAG: putative cell wall binding protein [Clostridium sp. Maddingley MBC34-26]